MSQIVAALDGAKPIPDQSVVKMREALEAAYMFIRGESNQDLHDCLDQIKEALAE
jgi:hypothetical protein